MILVCRHYGKYQDGCFRHAGAGKTTLVEGLRDKFSPDGGYAPTILDFFMIK